MFSVSAKCVPCRWDENRDPDIDKHNKVTRGKRNVPVMLPDGETPAVKPDGTPDVQQVEFQHVYFQIDGHHAFHVEMPADEAKAFTIGVEYTLTIG